MKTKVIKKSSNAIEETLKWLKNGEVVIIPTENVYGLAGNADSKSVIDKIYELKKRDRSKPLVYFTSKRKAANYGYINDIAKKIIDLWPEGIGIIVMKKDSVPQYVTAGRDSIMLVCVDSFMETLANKADFPIVGTSANISGERSNADFESVFRTFNGKVPLIVNGGKSNRGVSGSIVDLTVKPPRIIREGAFSIALIKKILPDATYY